MKEQPIHKEKLELKVVPKTEVALPYTKICCPSCAIDVPAVDLNIHDKIAKCTNCDVVFSFQDKVTTSAPATIKQEVIRPEGIDLFYYKDEMEVTVAQPFSVWEFIPILLVPFYVMITTIIFLTKGMHFIWPLLSWLSVIVSSYYLYTWVTKHKVNLHIDKKYLSVEWRPKKMIKDKTYSVADIDQLYVTKGDGYMLYMTLNTLDGQKHVRLLRGINSISKARYLEQEIERHLGIEDRVVPEELKI